MGRNLKLDDQGNLKFFEGTGGGTSKITLQGPTTLAGDYTLTLPLAQASGTKFLQNDGAGVLSWALSTATLQSSYDNGGKITTAGAVPVEIEIGAASGNVGLLIDQDDDFAALSITKDGVGAGEGILLINAGTADAISVQCTAAARGFFLNIDADSIGATIDSEATTKPLLQLLGLNGNSQGDIAFGTSRTGDPSSPSEGDIWYESTAKVLKYRTDVASISLVADTDTQNTLDQAYDEGGAGVGRTITASDGAVQITGSAQTLLDLDQSGAFPALDFACGAAAGLIGTQANDNAMVDLTKTGTGAGTVFTLENDGTGIGILLDQDGAAVALSIDSEATASPLIELASVTGNTRGDIAFGTARTADPGSPSEGDLWYDGTLERIGFETSSGTTTVASNYGSGFGPSSSITISGGVATIDSGYVVANAETSTTDDLDTITASPAPQIGDTIAVRAGAGDTITVKHATGNLFLDSSADKVLITSNDFLVLLWNGSGWFQLSYSVNIP